MKKEDAEEYTAIREQHFHSSYRDILLGIKLGVPKALGLSTEAWVKRIGGRVQMSIEERKEAIKELKAEGLSDRKVGEVLGVHHSTVAKDRGGGNPPFLSQKPTENGGFPPPLQKSTKRTITVFDLPKDPPIKKPDYGQDDIDSLTKAKQAARHADEILAKIAKHGTSFHSLRENALAASNKWAQVANAAIKPATPDLREVD